LGTNLISRTSKKQPIVAISSTKVEYVAATSTSCQIVWMRRLLNDLAHMENEPTPIFCDNNSTIALSKNHVFHKKNKHKMMNFSSIRHFYKTFIKNVFEFQRQEVDILSIDKCNN
jgi:hypothetical protein